MTLKLQGKPMTRFCLIIHIVMVIGGNMLIMKKGKVPMKNVKRYVQFFEIPITVLVIFNFIGFHLDSIDLSSF